MATKSTKRKCLSFEVKQKIIDAVETGKESKAEICREYGLASSTLSTFLKDKDKIREAVERGSHKQKKQRTSEFPQVEKGLLMWFTEARSNEPIVWGATFKKIGEELADKLGHENFKMSRGRIGRFKRRHGIKFKSVNVESALARHIDTSDWDQILEYEPCDIYNADETGLFYKCLPNKTLAFQGENCSGMKPKDRITILCAVNMDGNDKLPLLVIGKFEKPRCLTNIHTYPVTYRHNKKAWMTSVLFEEWVRNLDRQFLLAGRSIALVIDNCSAHPRLTDLRAIKLFFLPSNTSILQPCGQGIIRTFKALYRKQLLRRYISEFDAAGSTDSLFKMTLLDAMVMSAIAWDNVEQSTILKCFAHTGFVKPNLNEDQEPTATSITRDPNNASTSQPQQDVEELSNLFVSLKSMTTIEFDMEHYIDIDKSVQTSETITLDDIIASVQNPAPDEEVNEDDDVEPEEAAISSISALQALDKVRSYIMQQKNAHAALHQIAALENALQQAATQSMKPFSLRHLVTTEFSDYDTV